MCPASGAVLRCGDASARRWAGVSPRLGFWAIGEFVTQGGALAGARVGAGLTKVAPLGQAGMGDWMIQHHEWRRVSILADAALPGG
jgi:hypothetical protein